MDTHSIVPVPATAADIAAGHSSLLSLPPLHRPPGEATHNRDPSPSAGMSATGVPGMPGVSVSDGVIGAGQSAHVNVSQEGWVGDGQTHEPSPSPLGVSAATASTLGVVDDGAVPSMVAVTGTGAGTGVGQGVGVILHTINALFCLFCFVRCLLPVTVMQQVLYLGLLLSLC